MRRKRPEDHRLGEQREAPLQGSQRKYKAVRGSDREATEGKARAGRQLKPWGMATRIWRRQPEFVLGVLSVDGDRNVRGRGQ